MAREAAHVQLVDHLVLERDARRAGAVPVELGADVERAAARPAGGAALAAARLDHAPAAAAGERRGVRIDQHRVGVEAVHRAVGSGARGAPAVAGARVEAGQLDVPDLPGAVGVGVERQLEHRFVAPPAEQHEGHRRRVLAEDGEVEPVPGVGDAEGQRSPGEGAQLAAERVVHRARSRAVRGGRGRHRRRRVRPRHG